MQGLRSLRVTCTNYLAKGKPTAGSATICHKGWLAKLLKLLTCIDNVGTLGLSVRPRQNYDAVTLDTTDAQTVRPYKGLHVLSLHIPL